MSKTPWGNIGAWAADAERADAEEREAAEKAAAAQPPPSFPSLKESVGASKQKKKTKMSLQEFTMQQSSSTYAGPAATRGPTHEELLRLPTGPKERSADDMQPGRLGGGFSNYGSGSGGSNQGRGRDYEGRRSYGFQDDDRRGGSPRVSEMNQHSRADEVDNWASIKKPIVPEYNSGQPRPGGKYSSLSGGGGGGPGAGSRADDADNWAPDKKTISLPQPQSRSSSFGSGFSRPESDRWTRNEQSVVSDAHKFEAEVVEKVNRPNPFGTARPREEVLAEKGLDWKKLDLDIEGKKAQNSVSGGSRPASSHSSRPESPLSSKSELVVSENAAKPKPKVNPFGNAKPREVLLEEKGLDWKKIDLNLENRRAERPEAEKEKNLKEEIERLKKESQEQSGDDQTATHNLVLQKEQELEALVRQLDDKVRYSQKNFERQGPGVGRGAGLYERPPSQPGAYDEPPRAGFQDRPSYDEPRGGGGYQDRPRSRSGMIYEDRRGSFGERPPSWRGGYDESRPGSRERPRSRQGEYEEARIDYNERPRSRGTVDSWSRGSDDRGAGQGGGGRGFFGSRDTDRSGSRW